MKELVAVVGWVVGIQGALGIAGKVFSEEPWGLLHKWWEIPTAGYAVIALVGAAIAVYGETSKRRA
ncbi:hypothetical protein [Streptomyces sp. TRM49041]|uniref:hypothetical protein n=1 Tax=Streptomyces sp. TRM49041 TaxID=2603216 RepID=UPI0011EC4D74|nr:hypothetical protein [Streptomyces sp. TRM49041]